MDTLSTNGKINVILLTPKNSDLNSNFCKDLEQNRIINLKVLNSEEKYIENLKVEGHKLDILVVDEDFSVYLGIEWVLDQLSMFNSFSDVIYLTRLSAEKRLAALKAGVSVFVTKQESGKELCAVIRNLNRKNLFNRNLRMMNKIQYYSEIINLSSDNREALFHVCQAAHQIFNADHSEVIFFNEDLTEGEIKSEYPSLNLLGKKLEISGIKEIERLILLREKIVISDLENDEKLSNLKTLINQLGVKSLVFAPVILNGKVVASLGIESSKINAFKEGDTKLFKLFTNLVSATIGNLKYQKELSIIQAMGKTIGETSLLDEGVILDALVYKHAEQLLGSNNFYVALYINGKYTFFCHKDKYDKVDEFSQDELQTGVTNYVRETKKPQLITKIKHDELIRNGIVKPVGHPFEVWLGAPMIARDEVIGVIAVQDYDRVDSYNEHDLEVLATVASQAAIGIDNARLLKEKDSRLNELKALFNTTKNMISYSNNPTKILENIVGDATKLLNGDIGQLRMFDQKGEIETIITHELGKVHEGDNDINIRKIINENTHENLIEEDLIYNKSKIGKLSVISLNSNFPFFKMEDKERLTRFATPAAIAVKNAKDNSLRQYLFDNSPSAFIAIDNKGIINQVNNAALQILGYSNESELLYQRVSSIYWNGFDEAKRIKSILKTKKKSPRIETSVRTKNGVRVPILLSPALMKDDKKRMIGSIGVMEDQRIGAIKGRVQKLLNSIENIIDSEGLDEVLDTITLSFVEIFEADSACVLIKKGRSLISESIYGCDSSFDQAFTVSGEFGFFASLESDKSAKTILSKDVPNEFFPLNDLSKSSLFIPLFSENFFHGIVCLESSNPGHFIPNDDLIPILAKQAALAINREQLLTERERTKEGLFASAHAVAAGQIATGFVHELKNSLNIIGVTANNLTDRIKKEQQLKSQNILLNKLKSIESAVWASYELAQKLQRFGQRLDPKKSLIYPNNLIDNSLDLIASEISKKKLKLEKDLDPRLSDPNKTGKNKSNLSEKQMPGNPVFIDGSQISQVLINLLLNAIEASSPRKVVLIKTRLAPKNDKVEFIVKDYGKGIEKENLSKIFEPFFTTKKEGVGLGLYISKIIIFDNHKGKIDVNSHPGKGTCFTVCLPNSKGGGE